MQEIDQQPPDWRRPLWLVLLVVASVAFTAAGFLCDLPLAAFAAVAACTLPRRDAYYLMGAVWLVNQGIGFAFHDYPATGTTFLWGAALGLCALLCTWAARQTVVRLGEMQIAARNAVVFLVAFAVYEVTLVGFSLWLGGLENYTPAIQGYIFAINILALLGLFALNRAGVAIGVTSSAPSPGR